MGLGIEKQAPLVRLFLGLCEVSSEGVLRTDLTLAEVTDLDGPLSTAEKLIHEKSRLTPSQSSPAYQEVKLSD